LPETEEKLRARGKQPELSIGSIPDLDKIMHGIPKDKLTVVGARTSMGKTSLVIQFIVDLITKGKSILYMGFEMKQDELLERIFCNKYQIPNVELLVGNFEKYIAQWDDFKQYLPNIKFVATDGFGKNWNDLSDFLNELDKSPDVVIVDYIQGISQGAGAGKSFIDEYILNFRNLCIQKGFAGIVVSQNNRASQDRKDTTPQLHDLKGSGYLEELCDLCLLLDWVGRGKEDEDQHEFIINVAKNRRGRTGFIKLKYYPEHYLFTDWNAKLNQATEEILAGDFEEN
jgi:replicative DNA helicase